MPVIETNVGRRKSGGRELLRLVAIGTVGVFMLTSAFSASFAGGGAGGRCGPGDDDDDDDGLSNAEVALIVVGGAVAVGVAAGALGLFGEDDDDDDKDSAKAKGPVQGARLTPGAAAVEAGTSSVFDLQVRYKGDSAWHSVSKSGAASFTAMGGLVRQDGTKNVFCAPLNAAGQKAVVKAVYAAPGQAPVSATTEMLVQN